jgi:hypothetical protein
MSDSEWLGLASLFDLIYSHTAAMACRQIENEATDNLSGALTMQTTSHTQK